MKKLLWSSCLLLAFQSLSAQTTALRTRLEAITANKKADVGVAIIDLSNGDTLSLHGNSHYPMQSVYKFHLSLKVMQLIDSGKLALSQGIFISKKELLPKTHSPLRDEFPKGNVTVPLQKIIGYTVSQSDNNGCDILFRLVGGTQAVEHYMRQLGITDVAIAATEAEMHQDGKKQYTNWTTPRAAAALLRAFVQQPILSESSHAALWEMMVNTTTGQHRIRGLLPKSAIVGHKTGSSGVYRGITPATNDIGILQLPNRKRIALAVFVGKSSENNDVNERIIAEIGQAVWEYYQQ